MSSRERTGIRPKEWSAWHRQDSTKRYLGGDALTASRLAMFDIDGVWVEAKHPYDRPPVALVEVAEVSSRLGSLDSHTKSGRVMMQLGQAANIPVFLILYKCDKRPNPADPSTRDIEEFYVKELFPFHGERWSVMTPGAMVEFELMLRSEHVRVKRNGAQLPLIPQQVDQMLTDDDLKRRWYSMTMMRDTR